MADLVPHPLVTSVALTLGQKTGSPLATEAANLLQATNKTGQSATDAATANDAKYVAQKEALAKAFANQANLAGLSLFAGFLGGPIVDNQNVTWRLLYIDSRLDSWMLIPEDAIIVYQQLTDDNAPSGVRDVLWVDATANLVHGSGPRTNDGRFLVGELTRAGDFAASTTGGTFSVATGLLCETTTPGRCLSSRTQ
jgi:hypothetical protein